MTDLHEAVVARLRRYADHIRDIRHMDSPQARLLEEQNLRVADERAARDIEARVIRSLDVERMRFTSAATSDGFAAGFRSGQEQMRARCITSAEQIDAASECMDCTDTKKIVVALRALPLAEPEGKEAT